MFKKNILRKKNSTITKEWNMYEKVEHTFN